MHYIGLTRATPPRTYRFLRSAARTFPNRKLSVYRTNMGFSKGEISECIQRLCKIFF